MARADQNAFAGELPVPRVRACPGSVKKAGVPRQLARFSRDVGYHCTFLRLSIHPIHLAVNVA